MKPLHLRARLLIPVGVPIWAEKRRNSSFRQIIDNTPGGSHAHAQHSTAQHSTASHSTAAQRRAARKQLTQAPHLTVRSRAVGYEAPTATPALVSSTKRLAAPSPSCLSPSSLFDFTGDRHQSIRVPLSWPGAPVDSGLTTPLGGPRFPLLLTLGTPAHLRLRSTLRTHSPPYLSVPPPGQRASRISVPTPRPSSQNRVRGPESKNLAPAVALLPLTRKSKPARPATKAGKKTSRKQKDQGEAESARREGQESRRSRRSPPHRVHTYSCRCHPGSHPK